MARALHPIHLILENPEVLQMQHVLSHQSFGPYLLPKTYPAIPVKSLSLLRLCHPPPLGNDADLNLPDVFLICPHPLSLWVPTLSPHALVQSQEGLPWSFPL